MEAKLDHGPVGLQGDELTLVQRPRPRSLRVEYRAWIERHGRRIHLDSPEMQQGLAERGAWTRLEDGSQVHAYNFADVLEVTHAVSKPPPVSRSRPTAGRSRVRVRARAPRARRAAKRGGTRGSPDDGGAGDGDGDGDGDGEPPGLATDAGPAAYESGPARLASPPGCRGRTAGGQR